jgi:hypothetical protein
LETLEKEVNLRGPVVHTEESLLALVAGFVRESREANNMVPTVDVFGAQEDGTVVIPPTPKLKNLAFGKEVQLLVKVSISKQQ